MTRVRRWEERHSVLAAVVYVLFVVVVGAFTYQCAEAEQDVRMQHRVTPGR